jgi:hypothetical protein
VIVSPWWRKLALTAHIVASVGWLGAVAAVLALAIVGLASDDAELVRAVYLAMDAAAWFVLLPLALASLLTGVVQSLISKWGLLRHYWVVFKLTINVFATIVLLMYTDTLGSLADLARATTPSAAESHLLQSPSPVLHAAVALLLLLAASALAIYKPAGLTRYGRRRPAASAAPQG